MSHLTNRDLGDKWLAEATPLVEAPVPCPLETAFPLLPVCPTLDAEVLPMLALPDLPVAKPAEDAYRMACLTYIRANVKGEF